MSSTISALKQLNFLLTKKEKKQWLEMAVFTCVTSILEIITAFAIVVFARSLNQPLTVLTYLHKMGIHHDMPATSVLFYLSFIVGVVYLVKNAFIAVETYHRNYVIQKMQHRCENSLLDRYVTMDYDTYLTKNSSYGLSNIQDVEEIFSRGVICFANAFSEGFIFICLIAMIVYMNPHLALTIFIGGLFSYYTVVKLVFPFFYRWGKILQAKDALCQKNLLQFFYSFKEVILSGKQKVFAETYSALSEEKVRLQAVIRTSNTMPRIVLEIIFIGLFVFVVSYLCLQKQTSQDMLATLAGYLYVGFRLMPGLNRMITELNVFKSTIPHIDRVYTEFAKVDTCDPYLNIRNFHFNHHIKLSNISYKYKQSEKLVLSNINLAIAKGECIGIIGETGSGKSTLVDIILGLLKPLEGSVLIDDQYTVHCEQWHQLIGYVPQSIYLIDDTISANIAYGEKPEEINQEKLNNAIEHAQLKKFLDNLPLGDQTIVGDRGILLSGGERQRIAIARALYREPQVLVFDEATSALDYPTEVALMETLESLRKNHTVIMIAHRLTTLKDCDRIIMVKKGTIDKETNYQALSQTVQYIDEKMH